MEENINKKNYKMPPEDDEDGGNKLEKIFERLRNSFDDEQVNKMICEVNEEMNDELLQDDVDHKEKSKELNKRK